jgi:signal peptidase I
MAELIDISSWGWLTWLYIAAIAWILFTYVRYLIEGDIPNLNIEIRSGATAIVVALVVRTFVAKASVISRDSADLITTLREGDGIIETKTGYLVTDPERGDLVEFRLPTWGELISRVIGLPGEWVEIEGGVVRIDGTVLPEPYVLVRPSYSFSGRVPDGCYFLLPDRRAGETVLTAGSQTWGVVRKQDLIGRIGFVFWPPRRIGPIGKPSYPSVH